MCVSQPTRDCQDALHLPPSARRAPPLHHGGDPVGELRRGHRLLQQRHRAVERARADAEAMATAAGGRLGLLLELSSAASFGPPRPMAMAMARVAAPAPTPISEGTETNSASVTARWQFVPTR